MNHLRFLVNEPSADFGEVNILRPPPMWEHIYRLMVHFTPNGRHFALFIDDVTPSPPYLPRGLWPRGF